MRLNQDFFSARADALAPLLLGKLLCRRADGGILRLRINETECYLGEDDTACHASRGRTARTETLYCRGGTAYVYLCYGIHSLLNVVSGAEGVPEAVLIRGAGEYNGPGKLTKALDITRELNCEWLCTSERLWLEDDGAPPPEYAATPRIGIDYAEARDRERLWRFITKE